MRKMDQNDKFYFVFSGKIIYTVLKSQTSEKVAKRQIMCRHPCTWRRGKNEIPRDRIENKGWMQFSILHTHTKPHWNICTFEMALKYKTLFLRRALLHETTNDKHL